MTTAPQPAKASPRGPTIPDDYWPMLAEIESGGNPSAKAGTSSASGLYQFIRATWLAEGGKWGADMSKPFGGLKPTADEQTSRAKTFTAKNATALIRAGIAINKASLYAAHFAGTATAARLILADVKADAAVIAGAAATAANKSIFMRQKADGSWRNATVGEFLTWLQRKTGDWAR